MQTPMFGHTTPEPRRMDANEIAARQQLATALARGANGYNIEDPAVRKVIAESQARLKWETEHEWLTTRQLADYTRLPEVSDAVRERMQVLGLGGVGQRILPRKGPGGQDTSEVVFHRANFDRWFENFDAVARSLGYARAEPTTAERVRAVGARVAGLATGAAVLFGFFG